MLQAIMTKPGKIIFKEIEKPKPKKSSGKLSFNQKRELEELESLIEKLEEEIGDIEAQFSTVTGDDVRELKEKYDAKSEKLMATMERWEELSMIEE